MELSVVIPARDEVENVRALTAEVIEAMSWVASFELIWVDDGSVDGTGDLLDELAADSPKRIRVIHHHRSCGQSTALRSGVLAAHGTWVATLDGDGQNDPGDLPSLLARREDDDAPDMIVGHRQGRQDTWLKRFASRVANRVRAAVLGDATPDSGCGLKVFRRELFLALPYFDHMHRFLPALAQREGAVVVSVPVGHRARAHGRSKYGINDRLWPGLMDLVGVHWLVRRDRRDGIHGEDGPGS